MDAVDGLHAWAANDGGEVLYTVNGGFQWNRVVVSGFDNYGRLQDVDFPTSLGWRWAATSSSAGTGPHRPLDRRRTGLAGAVHRPRRLMESVEALDPQTVLALGQIPLGPRFILRSTNAGQTWDDVSPSQAVCMATDFVDASTGWVVGGLIYKTTDGGQTWTQQFTPSELLYSVSVGDALHGWAVGWGPTLLRTTDGGQTWTSRTVPGTTNALFAVQALGPDVAWIAGANGLVARTGDGGQSWQLEPLPGLATWPIEALSFLDAEQGWAGGYSGSWRRSPFCRPASRATALKHVDLTIPNAGR